MKFLRLIEAHKHAEIVDYVKSCKCLASYEELALIERGNHEEIMTYFASHYLEYESFIALLKRGNLSEIRFYIIKNGIYDGCEDNLQPFLRNIANELADYILQFANDIKLLPNIEHGYEYNQQIAQYEKLIIKSGDHCALRRYIVRSGRPLQSSSLKLFNTKGIATTEDLLIYHLLYKA